MGNRSLRVELAKELKKIGCRLYAGNFRAARRYWTAHQMRYMLARLAIKPGDLINDCDGFNHRVIGPKVYYQAAENYYRHSLYTKFRYRTKVPMIDQFILDDGTWSCGCPYGPVEAWTVEQIEEFHRGGDDGDSLVEKLKRGESICDAQGIKLK
jgi:hypothetical protein